LTDAVIHVHDEVADLEIAQIGQERRGQRALAARRRPAPLLFEDVGFGVDLERGVGQPEPF
jgi:hypothetical protein